MKNVIIFTNDNGGVSVCIPTGELDIKQVQAKDCPVDSYIVAADTLPEADGDFFDAWEQTHGVITVNIEKAREIIKRRLRAERALPLAAQDVAYMRALELGEDTSAIVAEKQRLRDITQLADVATTLADLRSITATNQGGV